MLTLNNVSFAYGDTPLFTDVSLALPAQGAVCFTAPSGAGKTTLLRLFLGLETPQSGTVQSHGTRIATVFQEDRLFPWMTVAENVAVVAPHTNPAPFLEAVELTDAADKYPAELSGGMKRRVALARAMAYGGNVLLLDEPFNGLDAELRERIAYRIREQFAEGCIVLVTHTPEDAALLNASVIPLTFPLTGTVTQ